MWSYFDCLFHLAGLLLLLFTAFSYATGLMQLAELTDEYPTKTKICIQYIIYIIIILHILLPIFTTLSYHSIACGIITHLSHHQLNQSYPVIRLSSTYCISSIILLCISQYVWFYEFRLSSNATRILKLNNLSQYNQHHRAYNQVSSPQSQLQYVYTTGEVISFNLIMLWMIPLIYFITCTVTDTTLPNHTHKNKCTYSFDNSNSVDSTGKMNKSNQRRFNLRSLFNTIAMRSYNNMDHNNNGTNINVPLQYSLPVQPYHSSTSSSMCPSSTVASSSWDTLSSLPPRQSSYTQQRRTNQQNSFTTSSNNNYNIPQNKI